MVRGTTPSIVLTISGTGVNLSNANNVYVTFKNSGNTVTKTGADITVSTSQVTCSFTQAESLAFTEGEYVEVQVNWTYTEGGATKRAATYPQKVRVVKQLLPEVLS